MKVLPQHRFRPRKEGLPSDARNGEVVRKEWVPGQPVGDSLTRDAGRLLATLGQAETSAFVDPTDPASVLIHRRRSGISVGAGRFALAAAEALVRGDLACWSAAASGRRNLQLTDAGEAHLRRGLAPEAAMAFFHQHRGNGDGHDRDRCRTDAGTRRCGGEPARLAAPPQGPQRRADDRRGLLSGRGASADGHHAGGAAAGRHRALGRDAERAAVLHRPAMPQTGWLRPARGCGTPSMPSAAISAICCWISAAS